MAGVSAYRREAAFISLVMAQMACGAQWHGNIRRKMRQLSAKYRNNGVNGGENGIMASASMA